MLAVCLCVAVGIGAAMVLTRSTDVRFADASARTGVIGAIELTPGGTHTEHLTIEQDRFAGIDLYTQTPRIATPGCTLTATLTDDDQQTVVDSAAKPCGELKDTFRYVSLFRFPSIESSSGRHYTITYELTGGAGDAVGLWLTAPEAVTDATPPECRILAAAPTPEMERGRTTATPVYSAASWHEQISTALNRATSLAPPWAGPLWVASWVLLGAVAFTTAVSTALRGRIGLAAGAVFAFTFFKGLVWLVMTPAMNGADELRHLQYVQYLATNGVPTDLTMTDTYFPPQISALDALSHHRAVLPTDVFDFATAPAAGQMIDAMGERAILPPTTATYSPVYYLYASIFYRLSPHAALQRVYDVRLGSLLLGCLAALATFYLLYVLLSGRLVPATLITLAVSLHPLISQQFAVVNSDALQVSMQLIAAALAVSLFRGGGIPAAIGASLATAIATLAKPQGILVAPFVALAIVAAWRRQEDRRFTILLGQASAAVGTFIAAYAWWPMAKAPVDSFGPSVASGQTEGASASGSTPPGLADLLRDFVTLQLQDRAYRFRFRWIEQLWGQIAWGDVWLPEGTYKVLTIVLGLLSLAVLTWCIWRLVRRLIRCDPTGRPAPFPVTATWLAIGMCATYLAGINAVGAFDFSTKGGIDNLIQGRYILAMIPAVLVLPVLLSGHLHRAWRSIRAKVARAPRHRSTTSALTSGTQSAPHFGYASAAITLGAMAALQTVALLTLADRLIL